MNLALWIVASYLLGSTPTSYLIGKLFASKDLRELGSKNLGATNVYRVFGLKYAVPVAIIDIAKGVIPVVVFARFAGAEAWIPITLGSAAVFGHVFSVFVKFRGGKGVATASGAVLALAPKAFLVSLVAWIAAVTFTGYVSVASMLAAVVFPLAARFTRPEDVYVFSVGMVLAGFIIFTHRSNIRRLVMGTEHRFGKWRVGAS